MPDYEAFFTSIKSTDINKSLMAASFLFPEEQTDLVS